MHHRLVSVRATLALLLAASTARAQGTSEIRGKVSDSQSAVLPGVAVTIKNQDTGMFRETATRADGTYFITALLPGR